MTSIIWRRVAGLRFHDVLDDHLDAVGFGQRQRRTQHLLHIRCDLLDQRRETCLDEVEAVVLVPVVERRVDDHLLGAQSGGGLDAGGVLLADHLGGVRIATGDVQPDERTVDAQTSLEPVNGRLGPNDGVLPVGEWLGEHEVLDFEVSGIGIEPAAVRRDVFDHQCGADLEREHVQSFREVWTQGRSSPLCALL